MHTEGSGLLMLGEDLRRANRMRSDSNSNLVETAHRAGMAEVANEVLHNVGNVLNTLNISLTQLLEMQGRSPVSTICEVLHLMIQQGANLPDFLREDYRGRKILLHLPMFEKLLLEEQVQVQAELNTLHAQCQHLRDIIASQQTHAQNTILLEQVSLPKLVGTALDLAAESILSHKVIVRQFIQTQDTGLVAKTKLLQVMVNLIRNACEASSRLPPSERDIRIHLQSEPIAGQSDMRRVLFSVADNGHGIAAENLTRIFAYGYTTKATGHGFGLHSCANVMAELSGTIGAFSAGLDQGATFTITFPMQICSSSPPEGTPPSFVSVSSDSEGGYAAIPFHELSPYAGAAVGVSPISLGG